MSLAQAPTPAPAQQDPVVGIIGAILTAGSSVAGKIIESETQQKIAKTQAKADQRQAQIQAQLQQDTARLMASLQPAPSPINFTTIALVGGLGLGAVLLAVTLSKPKKKDRDRDRDDDRLNGPPPWAQYPPQQWVQQPGPPPGPPQWAPQPPMARNRRRCAS